MQEMANREYRTVDDIFNDPDLEELLKPIEKNTKKSVVIDPDVRELQEIENWYKENGRKPEKSRVDLKERSLFNKLNRLIGSYDKLKDFDTYGLLVQESPDVYDQLADEVKQDVNTKSFNSLDDILNDDSVLFSGLDENNSFNVNLFNTEKVTRKQENNPEKRAQRQKMNDFGQYSTKFKQVQKELASGKRQLVSFKDYAILLHHYYVLKGQLIYIDAFGEEESKNNKNGVYNDKRVHVVYENGTESNVLYRGLAASLYGRGGKMVTDVETGTIELTADDYPTGYIYILKSLSKDPQISNIKSLYKVGFTAGSVKKRIANAENESTYLYAPVKLIEQIQIINLNPEVLETAIHHALTDYRLEVEIKAPNGKTITPREWFVIDLPKIEDIISHIVARLQSEQ